MATFFFFFFFFFFFVSGLKLDEKSIENGLEGQKFLVVRLFWGGCHHPNKWLLWPDCNGFRFFMKQSKAMIRNTGFISHSILISK